MNATITDDLEWGYKFVGTDLCTDDQQGGRFRYQLGEWRQAANPTVHDNPCPRHPGDGLCVARTLSGAQSGGMRVGASVMLLVGFEAGAVLAESHDKLRVARLWVHPDPLDPVRILATRYANLRSADLDSADLRYANLRSANLRYANLRSANLRSANLRSANLRSANLRSANLRSADLRYADLRYADLGSADLGSANLDSANLDSANLDSAKGNEWTVLPDGWTVSDNGYVVPS